MVTFLLSLVTFCLGLFRKSLVAIALWNLLSCHDFKSWDSKHTNFITIEFKRKRDGKQGSLESLESTFMEQELFWSQLTGDQPDQQADDSDVFTFKRALTAFRLGGRRQLKLDPNKNKVSFRIYNAEYYHEVVVVYHREFFLVSPQAGGMQCKYRLQEIELHPAPGKELLFTDKAFNNRIPLKNQEDSRSDNDPHVTLYY